MERKKYLWYWRHIAPILCMTLFGSAVQTAGVLCGRTSGLNNNNNVVQFICGPRGGSGVPVSMGTPLSIITHIDSGAVQMPMDLI